MKSARADLRTGWPSNPAQPALSRSGDCITRDSAQPDAYRGGGHGAHVSEGVLVVRRCPCAAEQPMNFSSFDRVFFSETNVMPGTGQALAH